MIILCAFFLFSKVKLSNIYLSSYLQSNFISILQVSFFKKKVLFFLLDIIVLVWLYSLIFWTFIVFLPLWLILFVSFLKTHCHSKIWRCSPMFSSKSYTVLPFTFRFAVYLNLFLSKKCELGVQTNILSMRMPSWSSTFYWIDHLLYTTLQGHVCLNGGTVNVILFLES